MSAVDTLRDALYGNPPNPNWLPSREGTLKAFSELLAQVNALTLGVVSYDTAADLPADAPDGSQARVTDDPTTSNNTYWIKRDGVWQIDVDLIESISAIVQPLVDEATLQAGKSAASANTALETQSEIEGKLAALNIFVVNIPGIALALADQTTGKLIFYIDADGVHFGDRNIARQVYGSGITNAARPYLGIANAGGIGLMARATGPIAPSEASEHDLGKYGHMRGRPLKPFTIGFTNDIRIPEVFRSTATGLRIPGGATDKKGNVMVLWEHRTGGDFDPKGISGVVSRAYGREGSWTFLGQFISDPAYAFGDPTGIYDPIDNRYLFISYVRPLGYFNGDDQTTEPGKTTLIGGWAYDLTADRFTNWDGTPLPAVATFADLTDLTAAKPPAWGAFTPGPGVGVFRQRDQLPWFVGSGYPPGKSAAGQTPGFGSARGVCMLRYNRQTKRLDPAFVAPPTDNNFNESTVTTTNDDSGFVISSRIQGTKRRGRVAFYPELGYWEAATIDLGFTDSQKAGGLCRLTREPGDPPAAVLTSLHHPTDNSDLRAMVSYDDLRSFPTERSIYDNIAPGDARRWVYQDEWGTPLTTPRLFSNNSQYSFPLEVAPGLLLIIFEGQVIVGAAGDAIGGQINAVHVNLPDLLETRRA